MQFFLIEQQSGRICDANSAASLMYGYDHEELIRLKKLIYQMNPKRQNRQPLIRSRGFRSGTIDIKKEGFFQ